MNFPKKYDYFADREGRAAFIAKTFKSEIVQADSILDVGCDYNTLKKIIGEKVTGIDLYGAPDIIVDFEKEKLSRFSNNQFNLVVCTEVLEHLENFHQMLNELVRVSNKHVLISLPNCMSIFARFNILLHGNAGKYYGLPFQMPEDRHRWFFSHLDIEHFFQNYQKDNSVRIVRRFLHCNFSNSWKGNLMRSLVKVFGINTASQSYWILLEKK